jgi:hypothetical protein
MADFGVKLAAIVMLHNSCEQFHYRLVRFGVIANRAQAEKWIAEKTVTVCRIVSCNIEALVDDHLEKWYGDLERDSLLKKWDKLVALAGYPPELSDEYWHFDRDMLLEFDEVRHNAVHHDGQGVKKFMLDEFLTLLWRAQFVWISILLEICSCRSRQRCFSASRDIASCVIVFVISFSGRVG